MLEDLPFLHADGITLVARCSSCRGERFETEHGIGSVYAFCPPDGNSRFGSTDGPDIEGPVRCARCVRKHSATADPGSAIEPQAPAIPALSPVGADQVRFVINQAIRRWDDPTRSPRSRAMEAWFILFSLRIAVDLMPAGLRKRFLELWRAYGDFETYQATLPALNEALERMTDEDLARCEALTREARNWSELP